MKKRILSALMIAFVLMTQLPVNALARGDSHKKSVCTWEEFERALQDPDCKIISLDSDISTPQESGEDGLIIHQDLAIRGNGYELGLRCGGIILGGDLEMEDVAVNFITPTRNAIVVNGYTLRLNNVTNVQDKFPTNIFCGSITQYTGNGSIPAAGPHGKILVEGPCELGDLFAGSLCDASATDTPQANTFAKPASIKLSKKFIESRSSSITGIYAHGAYEPRHGLNVGGMSPDPSLFKATNDVTIDLYDVKSNLKIDGETGSSKNASVIYNGEKKNGASSAQFINLSELHVLSGDLKPSNGSTFANDAKVEVAKDGQLNFENYENPTIRDFSGGGDISLKQRQTLTITGKVEGSTKVAIGGFKGSDSSWEEPVSGHPYIEAPQSAADSFTLRTTNTQKQLVLGSNGQWTVPTGSAAPDVTQLTSFAITGDTDVTVAQSAMMEQEFTVSCKFTDDTTLPSLAAVPLSYEVNVDGDPKSPYEGKPIKSKGDYISLISSLNLRFEHDSDEDGEGSLTIKRNTNSQSIPVGTYTITVKAPIKGQKEQSQTITLRVTANDVTPPPQPPVVHSHVWEFSANGPTLQATCKGAGECPISGKTASVVLTAPQDTMYDGSPKLVTLHGNIPDFTPPAIKYRKSSEASANAVTQAPTVPGSYIAELTHSNQTATLPFNITKASIPQIQDIQINRKFTETEITVSDIHKRLPSDAGKLIYTVDTSNLSDKIADKNNLTVRSDGSMTVRLTGAAAGEKIIIPISVESDNYQTISFQIIIILTDKNNQAPLHFDPPASVTYGNTLTLTASGGSSSKAITFELSSISGHANYNGSVLTPITAGEIKVRAIKSGDNEFNDVQSDWKTITIEKAQLHITAPTLKAKVNEQAPQLSGNMCIVTGLVNGDTLSSIGISPTLSYADLPDMSAAGTTVILASGPASSENYHITYDNGSLTIEGSSGNGSSGNGSSGNGSSGNGSSGNGSSGNGSSGNGSSGNSSSGNGSSGNGSSGNSSSGNGSSGNSPSGNGSSGNNRPSSKPAHSQKNNTSTTETIKKPDDTVIKTNKLADGTTIMAVQNTNGVKAAVQVDKHGKTEAAVTIPAQAISEATQQDRPVTLSIPPVKVTNDPHTTSVLNIKTEDKVNVSIPVDWATFGTVAMIIHPNGTEQIVRKSVTDIDNVTLPVSSNTTIKIINNQKPFTDISGHWAKNAIDFVTSRELYNGTNTTTFSPEQPMTRGMFAVILHNLENNPDTQTTNYFPDIPKDAWYETAAQWATKQNIIRGDNNLFLADRSLTREQLAVMLYRYAGSPEISHSLSTFTDTSKVSSYATNAMQWVVEKGIIRGKENKTLAPHAEVSRAEVAVMLMRFLESSINK